jgi:hypothetical protein
MRSILLLIFTVSTFASAFDAEPRPVTLPNSRVAVAISGTPAPGYFLIGSVDNDSVGLIDNAGILRFTHHTGPNVNITPTPYGGLTYYHGNLGRYVVLDDNLRAIDTFGVDAPHITDFHEGYQVRGRRFLVLGTEERTIDMSTRVANGYYEAKVIGAVIQEFDRYGRKTFEWKSLDHISPLETTPDVDLTNKRIDYIHVNSISEDTDRNLLVSCRNLDQVIKINKSTGTIMWRFGGSAAQSSDFAILNDENSGFHGFSHQHTVMRARNGDLIMFDNGNLRPIPFSRAVAYKIDEDQKTATKTWEYISRDMQIASTMGSVQELSNGNILIGWGSTPTGLIASEVDRNGTLHAEITSLSPLAVPYRIRKAVIAMTASTRVIDTLGRFSFSSFDSTTRVTAHLTSVLSPLQITVEKHNYVPNNMLFRTDEPCHPIPLRWTVRLSDSADVQGSLSFDLSRLLGEISINDVQLYHRPVENEGQFDTLSTTSVDGSQTLILPSILPGEYLVASRYCSQPTLRVPNNNSVVGTSVMMEWTEAVGADGYEVEVSDDPAFANDTWLYRTQHNDTTLSWFSPGTTYFWRVRVIRQPEVGPWTLPWSFTTPYTTSVRVDRENAWFQQRGTHLEFNNIQSSVVELFDVTGQSVLRVTTPDRIDITHLHPGIYLVVASSGVNTEHRAVICR